MRYLALFFLLLMIFMFLLIVGNEFTYIFNVLIVVLIYLTLFFWELSSIDKKIKSQFKIRSQRKSLSIIDFIFSGFWSIYIYATLNQNHITILLFFITWVSPFIKVIMYFIFKKKKPYTIHVNDEELILIDRWTQNRDITKTNQIGFDRINKQIKLSFDIGRSVYIQTKNYNKEDIDELLSIIIEKSIHPIFIPNNYKEQKVKSS